MRTEIEVKLDPPPSVFLKVTAKDLAEIFAGADCEAQAEFLRMALGAIRSKFPMQLDFIANELADLKYEETRRSLAELIAPAP